MTADKEPPKVIILDDNPLSIISYLEEYNMEFDDKGNMVKKECPPEYELRLCPTCNTMKNIPKGHTQCMRCSFKELKKLELK